MYLSALLYEFIEKNWQTYDFPATTSVNILEDNECSYHLALQIKIKIF